MDLNPLLTIAILTYNRSNYLNQLLSSMVSQTYKNFVLVILDNASTDNTSQIVEKYTIELNLKYIRHNQNIGALANYNYALTMCETPYLLIAHDDDILKPDMIKTEIETLINEPDVNLVCCDVDLIDSEGALIQENPYNSGFRLGNEHYDSRLQFIQQYISGRNYINCPTAMLRVNVIRENNLWFSDQVGPGLDSFFWLQLNTFPGKIKFIGKSLYQYRIHPAQDSSQRQWEIGLKLKKPVMELLKENSMVALLPKARKYFNQSIFHFIFSAWKTKSPKMPSKGFFKNMVLAAGDYLLETLLTLYYLSPNFLYFINKILKYLKITINTIFRLFHG